MKQGIDQLKNRCYRLLPWLVGILSGLLILPSPAWAFIPHWDPREAFFIRQFAYLFWALAMFFFIFALRQEKVQQHRGFKFLVWAGIFFALWNFDCFIGQFIALFMDFPGGGGLKPGADPELATTKVGLWLYYLTKLDHLLLVPAYLCFYLGMRAFSRDPEVRPR